MKLLKLLVVVMIAILSAHVDAGYVKGYTRKDGTYVAPHYRNTNTKTYSGSTAKSSRGSYTKETSSMTKYTGKSYDVYQQRKAQGSRSFSKSMRQRKYDEQGGNCAHCGKHCESVSEMDGDHIVPYSKGGKTVESNLQMLCPHCNRSKGNRYSY